MADDRSLSELQTDLKDRQDKLVQLRADRAAAQQASEEEVYKAQLLAEIDRVNLDISTEETLLDNQQHIDPAQVGAGVVNNPDAEEAEKVEPAPVPTPPNPAEATEGEPSIQPETTPGNQPGDSEQPGQPAAAEQTDQTDQAAQPDNTNEEGNV